MAAGVRAGQAFAAAYTRAKRSLGVADFDDLIAWTRRLLVKPGMGEWVRYKLDRRTDHILVDESQDTNRQQWEIVQALAAEFFSGSSESERRHRTLFMVGDFKQAIFRFQGTDPQEFRRAVEWAQRQCRGAPCVGDRGRGRLGAARVQAAVDRIQLPLGAGDPRCRRCCYRAGRTPQFRASISRPTGIAPISATGLARSTLWSPFATDSGADDDGEEGWLGEDVRNYAGEIAKEVRRWLDAKPVLASTGRPLSAGDILVLVRSRGELASLIVARLFSEGVPVAGIDRLHLQKPLAVRDLLAAVAFAVQPLDDLNLANLLVSPLIGWDQDQLRELAMGRSGRLWPALIARSDDAPAFEDARVTLNSLLAMADYTTPHQFLETILSGPIAGRRKLYSRLGLAARDPIDELLSSALEFERQEAASLDRFMAWFARGDVEIKRDPSAPMNAVRVMTVHGAKGLEAPVVLLADATADPSRQGGPPRSLQFPVPGVGKAPLLRPRKADRMSPFAEVMADDEQRDLEEHWRLLYVALTRASEKLVVAGLDTSNKAGALPENCWFTKVEQALHGLGAEAVPGGPWGEALTYRGSVAARPVTPKAPAKPLGAPLIPDWAMQPAPPEARPPRPLAPSAMAEDRDASPPPSADQRAAARRGTLIHQLFERLPEVELEHRVPAALQWLERSAGIAEAEERQELAELVCAILDHPDFAPLFGPGSLAEAPIAATLEDGRVLAGTVDRLLVEDERVSVIDFKTGRVPATDGRNPGLAPRPNEGLCRRSWR